MANFKIEEGEKGEVIAKASFRKKEDFKVVTLNNDKTGKKRMLHVIQADNLIKAKKATEVKGAKIEQVPEKIIIRPSNKKYPKIN